MYDDPTPISQDAEQAKTWVDDELAWTDVYSKKPIEYLEAIAEGKTPKWDNEKGGYVYGDDEVSETAIGGSKPTKTQDPQADAETDTDLPF